MTDPTLYVDLVAADMRVRAWRGLRKYGTTLERADLGLEAWLTHAYEEAQDLTLYLRRAIEEERERKRLAREAAGLPEPGFAFAMGVPDE